MTACVALLREPTREQLRESYSVGNLLRSVQAYCKSVGKRDVAYGSLKTYLLRLDGEHERRKVGGQDVLFSVRQRNALHSPKRARRKYAEETRRKHDQLLAASGHWEKVSRSSYRWHRKPILALADPPELPVKVYWSNIKIYRRNSPADAELAFSTIYTASARRVRSPSAQPLTPEEIDAVEAEWFEPKQTFRPKAAPAALQPASLEVLSSIQDTNPPCNPVLPSPAPTPPPVAAPAVEEGLQGTDLPVFADKTAMWAWSEERQKAQPGGLTLSQMAHVATENARLILAADANAFAHPKLDVSTKPAPPRPQLRVADTPEAHRQILSLQKLELCEQLAEEHPLAEVERAVDFTDIAAPQHMLATLLGHVAPRQMLLRIAQKGYCLLAWQHGLRHVCQSRSQFTDMLGAMVHAAGRYDAWFQGKAGGWSPYTALRGKRRPRGAAGRGNVRQGA